MVWLGSSVIGDELHWRINLKAAIGVDQDRFRFTEKPPATTDHNPHGPTPRALQGDYPLEYYGTAPRSSPPAWTAGLCPPWRRPPNGRARRGRCDRGRNTGN